MKRFTSLLLAVLTVVTMTSASLLSVSAAEISTVSVGMPEEAYFTGDGEKDAFEVSFDLELADGMTAIAGYEIEVTWDPALLSWGGIVFEGEGITATNVNEGSATVAAVNASDVLSGKLFAVTFVPLATGNATVSANVESMKSLASATGLVAAEGSKASVRLAEPAVIYDDPHTIVEMSMDVKQGEALSDGYAYTLSGTIIEVLTPYDAQTGTVTVAMLVKGTKGIASEVEFRCTELQGEGVDKLKVHDFITVTGQIGNCCFLAGCRLDSYTGAVTYDTPEAIVNAAYDLKEGERLTSVLYRYTLAGKVTEIHTPYDEATETVSVFFVIEGMEDKPILCSNMRSVLSDVGIDAVKAGDTVTVTGILMNYQGTVQFAFECEMEGYVPAKPPVVIYETDEEILGAAYGLAEGETLSDGHPYQLSGVVLSVDADGSVTIQVGELKDYPLLCIRLTGEGAADLAVGDTITVKGAIKNDAGKIGVVDGALLEVVKAPTVAFGDIDGDGKVGKLDYFKLKTFLMDKPINFTDEMLSRSDIDGSGKVNKKDYFQLRLYLLGKWSPAE